MKITVEKQAFPFHANENVWVPIAVFNSAADAFDYIFYRLDKEMDGSGRRPSWKITPESETQQVKPR